MSTTTRADADDVTREDGDDGPALGALSPMPSSAQPASGVPTTTAEDAALRARLREELEGTRVLFHALVAEVGRSGWTTRSGNPAWTNGQLLWHVAIGARFASRLMGRVARGKGVNPPMRLFDPLNAWMGRVGAWRSTPESVLRLYDSGMDGVLAALEAVPIDAWQQSAMVLGVRTLLEDAFHGVRWHYETHAPDIR